MPATPAIGADTHGRADQMAPMGDRDAAIEQASEAAVAKAIQAGADPLQVSVVEVLETHVPYTAQPTVNVTVKAAGPLARLSAEVPVR